MEQNDMLVIGVAVVLLLISFVVWRLNHVAATYVLQDPSGGTKSKTTVIVNVKKPDGTDEQGNSNRGEAAELGGAHCLSESAVQKKAQPCWGWAFRYVVVGWNPAPNLSNSAPYNRFELLRKGAERCGIQPLMSAILPVPTGRGHQQRASEGAPVRFPFAELNPRPQIRVSHL